MVSVHLHGTRENHQMHYKEWSLTSFELEKETRINIKM